MHNICINYSFLEQNIKHSSWWAKASNTIDSHYSNTSGVMLTHHLEAVYNNIVEIFNQPEIGFIGKLFSLVNQLKMNKEELLNELKIVALLHDIGKTEEDKSQIIPHPITGKPAHLRHGLVSLMASMEIIGSTIIAFPRQQNSMYRAVELHDMSYGLYREFLLKNQLPSMERLQKIDHKIYPTQGGGLMYLLLFKLADIHGHANIEDVIWFYTIAKEYYQQSGIELPIPNEGDIR
jgi:hypothetical protein